MYISRKFLKEKYSAFKWDMENYLKVLDESMPDSITEEEAARVRANIADKANSILAELGVAKITI